MDLGDTIAAEATPPGRGALRVVRVSGPGAVSLLKEIFSAPGPLPWERPRTLCLGSVGAPGQPALDRVLAVCFPAPDSLTGEDVVEFQAHGAPGVVRGILDLAASSGARTALPGEFSYRAYLNGKMSIMEAEAVNALVSAQTEGQAARLNAGVKGGLDRELRGLLDRLMDLRADWEMTIDFPEDAEALEAGDAGTFEAAKDALRFAEGSLGKLVEEAGALRYLREGWRVALVGPVNSGKSSLFNALLRRERALVTPHPGTTRDVLEESLQIGGYPLILMDTAGVRETLDPVESLGVALGRDMAERADALLFVYDASRGWGAEEAVALEQLGRAPLVVVANKCDLGSAVIRDGALSVSALAGEGMDRLSARLASWMEDSLPARREILACERQIEAARRAQEGCRAALEALSAGAPVDLAVEGVAAAQGALDDLLTGGAAEDLYDRIFSRFCLGK